MKLVRFLRCYIHSIAEDELGMRAGALAYFATFSLFPLLLLLTSFFARFLPDIEEIEQLIALEFLRFLPDQGQFLVETINSLAQAGRNAGIIGAIGLLWAASGFFRGLEVTTNRIFGAEQLRPTWLSRGIGMLMALLMGPVLILAVILTSLSQALLNLSLLPETIKNALNATSNILVLLAILSLMIFLLYRYVPWKRPRFVPALAGAVLTAIAWSIATRVLFWAVSAGLKDFSVIYGSISAVIAFIFWLYVSNFILLLGAELTAYLGKTKQCEPPPLAPAVIDILERLHLPADRL